MAIILSDNININSPKILDDRYGPWSSVSQANASVIPLQRQKGLTVGILSGTGVVEYWYLNGTSDSDLVEKTIIPQPNNIYVADGTLTGNRIVNLSSFTLTFTSTTNPNGIVFSGNTINGVRIESHASRHQHGGSDEVGTATPAPNAIPKANASGNLNSWISAASETVRGLTTLSTAPSNPSNPISVSVTDPRFLSAFTGASVSGGTIIFSNNTGGTVSYSASTLRWFAEPSTPPSVSPLVTGSTSIAIGDGAQALSENMFVAGNQSGVDSTLSDNAVIIGSNAGNSAINNQSTVSIGDYAGSFSNNVIFSTFIGPYAGVYTRNSFFSNFIGIASGYESESLSYSNIIGNNAGYGMSGSSFSTVIGDNAGYGSYNATRSIIIGASAGKFITNQLNILIGAVAGNAEIFGTSIGSNNIIIGNGSTLPANTSNSLNIGNIIFGKDIYRSDTTTKSSAQNDGMVGINVVPSAITNALHVSAATNPLRIEGVVDGTDNDYLTIDANGVVKKRQLNITTTKKIHLNRIDFGGKYINTDVDPNLSERLKNVLDNGVLRYQSRYFGAKVAYYYTINDADNQRKNILFLIQTVGDDYDASAAFADMVAFIYNEYGGIDVGIYVDVYLEVSSTRLSPINAKLVNPLFSSLKPLQYSKTKAYEAKSKFISPIGDWDIFSNFLAAPQMYYDTTVSQDIPKMVYDIVNDPRFYTTLSAEAATVICLDSWNNDTREVVMKSTTVEDVTRFYKKFNIPVNRHGFDFQNQTCTNNFYGEILYDVAGGEPTIYSANSSTSLYPSTAVLQLLDTSRIHPDGNVGVITFNGGLLLNSLKYDFPKKSDIKYISSRDETAIQVIPTYNDTYAIKLLMNGDAGNVDALQFLRNFFKTYYVLNDNSLKTGSLGNISKYFDYEFEGLSRNYFNTQSGFENNPFGPYIIIQSNDEKMAQLAQTQFITVNSACTVEILAIYKGKSFRPMLYPLNLTQLLFEVPQNYFVDGAVTPIENISENQFVYDEINGTITNKTLRLIAYFNGKKTYKISDFSIKYSVKRNSNSNNVFQLYINNIEDIYFDNQFRKYFRPNNVEIYLAFYDINTMATSVISDYKIIVTNYGDNEIFKLIRGSYDIN